MNLRKRVIITRLSPVGISYSDKGTFTLIDSIYAIKVNINPGFVIYFDLDSQKVTPIYNNDIIEIIGTNWQLIKDYPPPKKK